MRLVALTGGIGSGKSVVSQRLAARGAVVIDADAIVHELQRPGSPLLGLLAERFGSSIIRRDGSLDRAGLAAIAFHDDVALADLNDIVHPAVRAEIATRIEAERDTDHLVVLDTPLLTVTTGHTFAGTVVVDVPIDVAVERLVGLRGMDEEDARARIAKQMTREERRATADRIVDNSGDLDALDAQIDELWVWLESLPSVPHPVDVRWMTASIDRPAETFNAATTFWAHVTGSTPSPTTGQQGRFATLIPRDGDTYLRVQRVEAGPGDVHLDLHVGDVPAARAIAESLGASVAAIDHPVDDEVVLASPAGLPLRLVAHCGEPRVPTPTSRDGGVIRVQQVCIDVAPDRYEAETTFWATLTGWRRRPGMRPEYSGLDVPGTLPLRILFQRLDEAHADTDADAHLDVFCSDADAAADHHVRIGAEVVVDHSRWIVMRDPSGVEYCLVRRDPNG